jgi:sugar phosphate isomerase/epimerase
MKFPISVQMFTLRAETEKDFVGTLEKVAEIGYQGVEFAGYGNLTSVELKSHLDRLGLKASGSHVSLELIKNSLDEVIKYNLEIGNKHIICPMADFKDKEELLQLAAILKNAAEKCKESGLSFSYHNHAHEFKDIDDQHGLDVLFAESGELVLAEIDTYWVTRAGIDAAEYVRKYKGRCPLVHFKDMEPGEEKVFAEVGEGTMDFRSIAKAAEEAGAEWVVVEQDRCKRPALESVKISYDNLKAMGIIE